MTSRVGELNGKLNCASVDERNRGEFRIECSDPEAENKNSAPLFDAMAEAKKRA